MFACCVFQEVIPILIDCADSARVFIDTFLINPARFSTHKKPSFFTGHEKASMKDTNPACWLKDVGSFCNGV